GGPASASGKNVKATTAGSKTTTSTIVPGIPGVGKNSGITFKPRKEEPSGAAAKNTAWKKKKAWADMRTDDDTTEDESR
ncbi:unnamed protein product, partial [Amoebophrya sp. A25]